VWKPRYDQINAFEKMLAESGTTILKFFLHISKEEQKQRFQDRLADPKKNWKFSLGDVKEREYWDDYMRAYEDVFSRCSTPWAPWYIVPADRKWYRDLVIARTIVEALEKLDMHFPPPLPDADKIVIPD
jgi:polyphosphate kinase 2 (PPK2 family)